MPPELRIHYNKSKTNRTVIVIPRVPDDEVSNYDPIIINSREGDKPSCFQLGGA